jgi:ABC-type branched-subunit amino acid transport system substrate-binding protein
MDRQKTTIINTHRRFPRIVYIAIAGICLYLAISLSHCGQQSTESICDAAQNLDRLSCGQNIILTPADGGQSQPDKIAGFAAFKQKDFSKAINYLKKDWEATKDPETLIALSNATILRDRPTNVKTIAVVVPRSGSPVFIATSIIKGAAAAQQEWNNNQNHQWKLLLALADDSNQPESGKKIAAELVKHQDVLATLGHYSSTVTVEVKDIYQQAKTVLLSATATADELTDPDEEDPNNYFFRVLGSTQVSAHHLAQKWAIAKDKIALFYTPDKKYSASFRKAFFSHVPKESVVQEFDLSNLHDAVQELAAAKAAGAKAIVLIPDAFTTANERSRVLAVIKANQGELPIFGASPVRDAFLFKLNPQSLKNLIITIPLHPSDRQFIDAARLNQAPNWWGVKSQLHERIINSFDGMQILLAALDKSTDRKTVRQTIAAPGFSVQGITGKISFNGSDRAQKIDSLVTPINCTEKDGCNFQLVN